MNSKRAVIYVRVSTANRTNSGDGFEQNPEVQEAPLRQMLAQRGWTLVRVYSDRMSGAKENRPGLNALMQASRGCMGSELKQITHTDKKARLASPLFSIQTVWRALDGPDIPNNDV